MGKNFILTRWRQWLQTGVMAVLLLTLSTGISGAGLLPAGNAITDAQSILRYALPIDNKPVRDLQNSLEDIANHLRGKQWSSINNDIKKAGEVLKTKQPDILKSVPEAKQATAQTLKQFPPPPKINPNFKPSGLKFWVKLASWKRRW
jgi:peptidylprolyl isomerase